MITLKTIFTKLCSIEDKLIDMERREKLGNHLYAIKLIEKHAQKCHSQYTLKEHQHHGASETYQLDCSCGNKEASIIFQDLKDPQYFKQCLNEINEKYKELPLSIPKTNNNLDRMEI